MRGTEPGSTLRIGEQAPSRHGGNPRHHRPGRRPCGRTRQSRLRIARSRRAPDLLRSRARVEAETSAQDALALTERIRDTVASIRVQGVERAITVSIGVADLIQHAGDAAALLRQADRALYTAKATGRNRVVIAGADDPSTESVGVNGSSGEPMSSHTGAGLNP